MKTMEEVMINCVLDRLNPRAHTMTRNEWHKDVQIVDKSINVQLDTDARCNVISAKIYNVWETKHMWSI